MIDEIEQSVQEDEQDSRLYVRDLARELGRDVHTIRRWISEAQEALELHGHLPEDKGLLPEHLWPGREGGRQQIFWRLDQFDGMREFAAAKRARSGWQGGRSS